MVGLCVALAPKQDSGGAFVALGVAAFLGTSGMVATGLATENESVRWAFLHPAGALQAAMLQHDGLWRRLFISSWRFERFADGGYTSWLAIVPFLSVVVSLLGGVTLLRAACRRLASPHRPLLSKRQSVVLFALVTAAIILPTQPSHSSEAMMITFITGLLLLPIAAALVTLSTPSFESWAMALRASKKLGWSDDDAGPLRAFLLMMVVYLLALKLRVTGFPMELRHGEAGGFVWSLGLAATLPLFALFGNTRYSTAQARFAFAAAVFAHVLYQIVVIVMFITANGVPRDNSSTSVLVELGMLLAVAVPAWVTFRQRNLAARVRAGATS
jgi:uncharacterized membrane protein SirB2